MTTPKTERTKWVCVYTTPITEEAHIVAGMLRTAGMAALINGTQSTAFGVVFGLTSQIEVLVDAEFEDAALALINDDGDENEEPDA